MAGARAFLPNMQSEKGTNADRQGEAEYQRRKSPPTSLSPPRLFDQRLRVDARRVDRQQLSWACRLEDRHR